MACLKISGLYLPSDGTRLAMALRDKSSISDMFLSKDSQTLYVKLKTSTANHKVVDDVDSFKSGVTFLVERNLEISTIDPSEFTKAQADHEQNGLSLVRTQ